MAAKTSKPKTETAEKGTTKTPVNETAKLLNEVNAWTMPEILDDDEAEKRTAEYFNLCVSKGEMPLFETYCLYLGISDEKGKSFANGEGCSTRLTKIIQGALTTMKAAEAKAVYAGKIRDVPYIWRSKQYYNYREPNSKLEDALLGSVLKELPTTKSIAARYLEDVEEVAEEAEDTREGV